jgi:hypothetical protein
VSLQAGQFWHEKSDQHEVAANMNSHKTEKKMTAERTMYLVREYREFSLELSVIQQ